MARYKITIEYKGTEYAGWQIQKNAVSIQSVIECSLKKIFNKDIKITGSGRTDSGVHALGQVAHFDCDTDIPASRIPHAVNSALPIDIRVKDCEIVSDDFHARYSAKSKTYVYKMYYSQHLSPLKYDFYHCVNKKPDIDKMVEGSKLFIGEHDFKAFQASNSSVMNTIRTVYSLDIMTIDNEIIIEINGNGFLYNMVRTIAGTLLYVGLGKLTLQDIYDILRDGDRSRVGKTLPANGLCLVKVEY